MRRSATRTRCSVGAGLLFAGLCLASPALADNYVGNIPPRVGASDTGAGSASDTGAGSASDKGAGSASDKGAGSASDKGAGSASVRSAAVQQTRAVPATTVGGLALTGSDVVGLTLMGAASVGAGIVIIRRSRPAVR